MVIKIKTGNRIFFITKAREIVRLEGSFIQANDFIRSPIAAAARMM